MRLPRHLRAARRATTFLPLALAAVGCATLRAPTRPTVADPLPLVAGVCPGPFGDYGGEGAQLLEAVRERRLFREVVALPGPGGRADLALVPTIGAPQGRGALGVITLVPWAATATIVPWLVQASNPVQVTVVRAEAGVARCGARDGGALVVHDTTRRTTSMAGWTSLLLMLHPRWEAGQIHEFRPAVDSLVARRAELLELGRAGAGGG